MDLTPDLCNHCYKYHTQTLVEYCETCQKLRFPERILCNLIRETKSKNSPFECRSFRPNLSLVGQEPAESIEIPKQLYSTDKQWEEHKLKWFDTYATQQLQLNPELISFKLRYHVCFITSHRHRHFKDINQDVKEIIKNIGQTGSQFEQTLIHLLWLAEDHLHLYIDTSPDYSLDEIVNKLMSHLESNLSGTQNLHSRNENLLEKNYFIESIG